MRRRIRKAGVLLLAGVILCGMSACGKDEPKVQIIEETVSEPEYLSFFSNTTLSANSVGKYWSESFAKEYNEQIYVNFDAADYYADAGLSYRELLEKRMESSSPDDLYIISAEDVLEFEKKGYWLDLSGLDFVDNLSEAALYQSTYNGKVFSVPLSFTGFGFYWNVDMLNRYGLDIPGNYDEFLETCERLKSEGIVPYGGNKGFALTVPAMCRGMAGLYGDAEREKRIEELNSGETAVSAYMRDGFEFISMMIEKGYLDPNQALDTTPGDDFKMLLDEECAFICTGVGAITQKNTEGMDFMTELTGLPVLEDGDVAVYGADQRLCVNPESKHMDTALKFIEMVGTPEALEKSAELDSTMSSAKDSNNTSVPGQEEFRSLLQQPGQIPNQDFALHFNTWENIRNVCREICSGLSVDEACIKIDELQMTDLENYMPE